MLLGKTVKGRPIRYEWPGIEVYSGNRRKGPGTNYGDFLPEFLPPPECPLFWLCPRPAAMRVFPANTHMTIILAVFNNRQLVDEALADVDPAQTAIHL